MLRKLLKYEFKATARTMIPLYMVLILFSLFHLIVNPFALLESSSNSTLQTILGILDIFLYLALIVGVAIITFVIMIQRFYKSLLGDEGYLMFTLPVRTWQLIISRLLIAMLWSIASFLVTIGSVIIISRVPNLFGTIGEIIKVFRQILGIGGFFTVPLYLLASLASGGLLIYAAIALGHLLPKYRGLASFGMYIVLYMASQAILSLTMVLVSKMYDTNLNTIDTITDLTSPGRLNLSILLFTLTAFIIVAACFTITNLILKKRLNLD